MANYSVSTVDEFITASPEVARPHLREIKKLVESVMPAIEKEIGYGKPYYKYHGWVVGVDVYSKHLGFEVWDGLTPEDRQELEDSGYKTGSVTFQIRFDQPVPAAIIKRLVKQQIKKNQAKAKNKK